MTIRHSFIARRALITGAAAAAGAAALAGSARAARATGLDGRAGPATRRLATGGIDDWKSAVGTVFTARTAEGAVALRLASVEPIAQGGRRPAHLPRDHGFVARFEPLGGARPGEGTYRLTSAASLLILAVTRPWRRRVGRR